MYVINRDGKRESVKFDKIKTRLEKLSKGLSKIVDPVLVAQKSIESFKTGMKTSEIDFLSSEIAAALSTEHPDYGRFAARIMVSNLHKNTGDEFLKTAVLLNEHIASKTGKKAPLVSDDFVAFAKKHQKRIESAIDYERDNMFDYFGLKTLMNAYLFKVDGKIIERPQHLFMRVAIGVNAPDIEEVLKTYELMSTGVFTHATPTLFNAGTNTPQMSSCFLLSMAGDSIEGIYETLRRCALISKWGGGIGLSVQNVRSSQSHIAGTNGVSNGIVPMLKVFNETALYVNQGGKRNGSISVYLEPWHSDVEAFLDLRKNHGAEELRARDLFMALWIPDLFMSRVENDENWTLMCPNECPGLCDLYGEEFEAKYKEYEQAGKGRKTISARSLWLKILDSQIETGVPYILYKDAVNRKSNQKNLGTIRSSNLCVEIVEYTSPDEVAVCNLASIALPKFVEDRSFNYKKLSEIVQKVARNLNQVIDKNFYPVKEAERSNLRHRPIGIGVQGLSDVFMMMNVSYDSPEARQLNQEIFETIYFSALTASNELAKKEGPYKTYKGSPISKGIFQYQMWGLTDEDLSGMWDWGKLRESIKKHGVRNSLLVATMPTASTAQILGNIESFEPQTSNLYVRRTLAGEFVVVNKHLMKELIDRGLWSENMRQDLMRHNGSVQEIDYLPESIKSVYKTAWEISMRSVIDMAADRGPFIDQSQSMSVFVAEPAFNKMTSMHFYAWKKGLKTGMYYFRTRASADAIKFTVKQEIKQNKNSEEQEGVERKEDRLINTNISPSNDSQKALIEEKEPSRQKITTPIVSSDDDPTSPPNTCLSCGS
ncbi:MAG: ribonucleoside-diphosphate reductase subunit alpha [Candidatus Campbellbacteria bacterium]|nr:ribonucleoside-diphosphate reductase subunit alpha [Candidatus Campbellbacteria bacterium]